MRVVLTRHAAQMPHTAYCHTQSPGDKAAFVVHRAIYDAGFGLPVMQPLQGAERAIYVKVVRRRT